jgi:hypothetical protein
MGCISPLRIPAGALSAWMESHKQKEIAPIKYLEHVVFG